MLPWLAGPMGRALPRSATLRAEMTIRAATAAADDPAMRVQDKAASSSRSMIHSHPGTEAIRLREAAAGAVPILAPVAPEGVARE